MLAALLLLSASLVTSGVALLSVPAALVVAGVLLAAWGWYCLDDIAEAPGADE